MNRSDGEPAGDRLLYLITSDISARFLRGQLAAMVRHGYQVAVGVRPSDPPAAFDDGVHVHHVPFVREPNVMADVRALASTVRLMRQLRPQIVNASTPKAGLIGMVGAFLCRVPRRVYVVRGLRYETATGPSRTALRWLERLTTMCATDVVYNSLSLRSVAEQERTVRAGRGRVLGAGSGNGIDVERFRNIPTKQDARRALGIPPNESVIGFVGRLTRDKGIADLVEAVRGLSPEPTLLLVGAFETGDRLPESTITHIEDSARVIHLPWTEDTASVYPAMDVLAFPSYREGLPNVVLEAQLCGVPVVAYAATGTVDAVVDGVGGLLVDVGDVDALQRALEVALERDRDSLTGGAEWVKSRFDQPRIWTALAELYAGPSGPAAAPVRDGRQ